MLNFFQIVQIVSAVLLVCLVLLHSPKGDGLGAIGGAAQIFSSQKGAEAGLNKLTTIIAVVFIVVSFLLGFGLIK